MAGPIRVEHPRGHSVADLGGPRRRCRAPVFDRRRAGDRAAPCRTGLPLRGPEGGVDPRRGDACPDPGAGHPAGLARRVDLPRRAGPSAGRGPRCPGAQAVPLPSGVARSTRRVEVRSDGGVRSRAAQGPTARGAGPCPPGPVEGQGAGRDRVAARDDIHPDRQRSVCAGQRLVRPDDAAQPARHGLRRRPSVSIPGQGRHGPRGRRPRPAARPAGR